MEYNYIIQNNPEYIIKVNENEKQIYRNYNLYNLEINKNTIGLIIHSHHP